MTARPMSNKKLQQVLLDERGEGTIINGPFQSNESHVGEQFWFMCKGCGDIGGSGIHYFTTKHSGPDKHPVWGFDRNELSPTFSPSLLYRWTENGVPKVCHLFLKNGVIEYLTDCTHAYKGKSVPLSECEDV